MGEQTLTNTPAITSKEPINLLSSRKRTVMSFCNRRHKHTLVRSITNSDTHLKIISYEISLSLTHMQRMRIAPQSNHVGTIQPISYSNTASWQTINLGNIPRNQTSGATHQPINWDESSGGCAVCENVINLPKPWSGKAFSTVNHTKNIPFEALDILPADLII